MFKNNVGVADGAIRVFIGMALIFSALSGYFDPWGWIGVVPLLTAFTRNCMLYSILGLNTCKTCAKKG
ncbi:MAG: DUF2892 domain-containing protein [Mariprofundaceae bacterium]|nr:DUF2892 domain-containing protein [Mariprofundaceae bacterium]